MINVVYSAFMISVLANSERYQCSVKPPHLARVFDALKAVSYTHLDVYKRQLLMILALLAAPLKVIAAEQNGESSDKQQNETTEQKTEETEETAPEMTPDFGLTSPSRCV